MALARPFKPKDLEGFQCRDLQDRVTRILVRGAVEASRPIVTIEKNGEVLAIIIAHPVLPHSAEVCALVSDRVDKYKKSFHKCVKNLVPRFMAEQGLTRLQLSVDWNKYKYLSWAMALGFRYEGLLRNAGIDKQNLYILGRVH